MLGSHPRPGSEHPDFRLEIFGTWREPALPVEFMAGFRHRQEGQWRLVRPITRYEVSIGNTTVYVPDRDELRHMIESFGRPKDRERARLLDSIG